MTDKPKVLFICTGNSCRSQMAEAMLRDAAGDRFDACSAGSHPAGFVHELAIEALRQLRIDPGEPRSKSWDDFANTPVDVVITVCDQAAGEACPTWPGKPITAHWSMPDPTYHGGSEADRIAFALAVAKRLRDKIRAMAALDWSADRDVVKRQLDALGEI